MHTSSLLAPCLFTPFVKMMLQNPITSSDTTFKSSHSLEIPCAFGAKQYLL
ncbi:hypothetical protein BDF14DRAFT_1751878, partial [Spinellus fusiger]